MVSELTEGLHLSLRSAIEPLMSQECKQHTVPKLKQEPYKIEVMKVSFFAELQSLFYSCRAGFYS